jgi:hypothetical protein
VKKVAGTILLLLYVTVTSGVIVNIHNCMGMVRSVTFGHEQDGACGNCGMKDKKGCCHTDHKFVKLQDVHKIPVASSLPDLSPTELNSSFNQYSYAQSPATINLVVYANGPPDVSSPHIYLLNRVFRV